MPDYVSISDVAPKQPSEAAIKRARTLLQLVPATPPDTPGNSGWTERRRREFDTTDMYGDR